jgi:thymidylate synthase ThyX
MFSHYEEFSDNQRKVLEEYVTNTDSSIFALRNLPEVIKGALFSRYSRSSLGLRTLLLKEFIGESEASFAAIVGETSKEKQQSEEQAAAIKKAQNFYDRVLADYGDDSIGELGAAHLAIENVSMLAAKALEDCRLGGSPLEKSTRYIYFDQKFNGEYLFYREPVLMTSAYRDLYLDTCNMLFSTYSALIPRVTALIEQSFPKDPAISQGAYNAALRAKVLDCLRGLLPAGTLTNMGIQGNGRFYEQLIHKLHCSTLSELQEIGKRSHEELSKIIPSFIRRADAGHKTHEGYARFLETMETELKQMTEQHQGSCKKVIQPGVRLLSYDPHAMSKVAAALLFAHCDKGLGELREYCQHLSEEELAGIFDAACSARESRRHKSPRALEHAEFTFEIIADFGIYRDLHRHRTLTQERQLLCCDYGFYVPPEILGTDIEPEYCEALQKAKKAYDTMAHELPEEAQYVIPMAYNVRWYFHINLRSLQWLCELRSIAAGHPRYRFIAQTMAKEVCQQFPLFENFFKFVDYDGYELGRLGQEIRKEEKLQMLNGKFN